jgi:dGTPase
MNWTTLLKNVRVREGQGLNPIDGRNHFENDYSRLISSSFIRRLQDKTQVFPLHQSDFIRTRLTHSLEVSSIAKSIGKSIEKKLIESKKMDDNNSGLLPALLMTAGLIHDLGNPPFGHFGETAIQDFFSCYFSSANTKLTPKEQKDFTFFDGNVQTFRILTKLQFLGDEHSYNLTYPTLACIMKYPVSAEEGNKKGSKITLKKFGYFTTEKKEYNQISKSLELGENRHPATFLLEASDDIAYSAADIEDGIKLGILNFDIIKSIFVKEVEKYEAISNPTRDITAIIEILYKSIGKLDNLNKQFEGFNEDKLNLIVTKFRIFTQNIMIESVIDKFITEHDNILSGTYSNEILEDCAAKGIRNAFKELSKIVFKDSDVMQAEIAGYKVISDLLEKFVHNSTSLEFKENGRGMPARLYNLISSNLRYIYRNYSIDPDSEYCKLQLIIDFISGMTDSYAVSYHKKLNGISY